MYTIVLVWSYPIINKSVIISERHILILKFRHTMYIQCKGLNLHTPPSCDEHCHQRRKRLPSEEYAMRPQAASSLHCSSAFSVSPPFNKHQRWSWKAKLMILSIKLSFLRLLSVNPHQDLELFVAKERILEFL